MKKSLLIVLSCIICVMAFQAFTVSHDPEFKNLQILPKDISEHDLDSVMHHFSQSLGVHCDFCHVKNEAAKKMVRKNGEWLVDFKYSFIDGTAL